MKKCYIVGAGEDFGINITKRQRDYIIAADAGLDSLKRNGYNADLVIGDFDSSDKIPKHDNIIVLPAEKDDTDMMAAIKEGIKLGYEEFHILNGTGGRFDHTFANIQALSYLAERNMRGYLYARNEILTVIKNDTMEFGESLQGYVSVFSLSDTAFGVDIEGLKYELHDATLTSSFPLGVSNEFTGKKSIVRVREGSLLLIYPGTNK